MPRLFHIADKPTFKPDPSYEPTLNRTLVETLKPGLFLTELPELWASNYGYRRPYLIEFDVPADVLGHSIHGSNEVYIPAEFYDRLRIVRAITQDCYDWEKWKAYGGVDEMTGKNHITGEPLVEKSRSWGNVFYEPPAGGWVAPDARTLPTPILREYEKNYRAWRRKQPKGFMASRTARRRTAAALPTTGLYYRTHDHSRPFTVEDATSRSLSTSFDDYADQTRRGYSCLENPWDLWVYLIAFGWMKPHYIDNDDVICFSGTKKRNKGTDGEPLVVPDMQTVIRYSWPEFERLLMDTPRPAKPGGPGARHGYFESWHAVANRCWDAAKFSIVAKTLVDESLVAIGMDPQFGTKPKWTKTAGDYSGHHRAPTSADDVAAPFHDVEEMMPDYYEHPDYYRHDGGVVDRECAQAIRAARGKPDAMVTIYRALPPGLISINPGDWVTPSLAYARQHAISNGSDDWPVITATVPAKTLWTEGYAAEWGYSGPSIGARTARVHSDSLSDDGRAWSQTVAKTASDTYSDSVMVALRPNDATCKAFAEMGECTEAVEDLHVTLFYLGSTEDVGGEWGKERLYRALYAFAIDTAAQAVTGTPNGLGVFRNEQDTLIVLWDIPGIAEFRTRLGEKMREHGVPMREENHGFTPHMTLGYSDERISALPEIPEQVQGESETFGSIWLVWGEEWTEVTLH